MEILRPPHRVGTITSNEGGGGAGRGTIHFREGTWLIENQYASIKSVSLTVENT